MAKSADPAQVPATVPVTPDAAPESVTYEVSGERLRLQEAIEAIGEGFALWDAEDRLVLCNTRYHDFWQGLGESVQPGVSYKTLLKQVARMGLVDLEGEEPERWMRQRIAARERPTGPYTHQFSDGRIVQVNNTRTADGGIVTVFSDVSALLEVEEARRLRAVAEGAALLASTVTNIAQGVGVFNASQRLLTWNRRACELLNIPYYAVQRGMSVRDLMDLLARNRAKLEPRVSTSILAWIDRRRPRAPTQVDVLYPGATVIEAAFRAMPDHGFVVTFTDKTAERQAKRTLEHRREELAMEVRARTRELVEVNLQLQREVRQRREAAEALEQARASAVAANLSKTKFLAAASHDLLQPLSAAHLYLSALEDAKAELSQSAQKHLAGLAGALLSVEGLLNALLEISKLDSGGIEPDWQIVPLQPLLNDLSHSFAGLAAEKGLRFRWVKTSAWARTDPVLLRRILQNLMTNSVKYTNSGGVLVGVRPDGEGLRIEVWDSGPGIPPGEQEVIFDEFQRGSGFEVGEVAGAGLGLAIVRRTVDLLGHRVTLRSERGRGTLFRVHLPRAAEEARVAPASRAIPAPTLNWQNRLVLMLENDPDIAKGMQALFTRWNCPLLAAASLEALLEALADEEAPPDFVIADLDLDTEINGLMAVEQLRAIYPGLPAALVTADRSKETAELAAARGVERFLKPIRPAELRAYMDHCFREAAGGD